MLLALLTSFASRAVPVEDLYVAEVLVASEDASRLAEGARAGLLQVLTRVSGTTAVDQSPSVQRALRDPSSYYYQYGYDSTDRVLMVDGETQPARILRLTFEPAAIARLLRDAGFPVWGSNRPGLMLWIAVADEDGRYILSEADDHPLLDTLARQARVRGLPLLYPILDLEDSARLSPAEVWGLFVERIDVASMRYNPDVVLAGRVQQEPGDQVSGSWSYRIEDRWEYVDARAGSVDELVSSIVNRLADQLAARYAVDSSQSNLMVRVEAVTGLADYADLGAYLESLAPVVESQVVEVDGDEVLFRLRTEGQVEQLRELIELDDKLLLMNAGETLQYRWIPQ